MMKIVLAAILTAVLCISGTLFAACPSADLTGDCFVNLADFVKMAEQWMTEGTPTPILYGMTWVSINDSGVGMKDEYGNSISQGGFTGEISKYETTNAQYCQYLNAAKASNAITVSENYVQSTVGRQIYYDLAGSGYTYNGATNGGAARINWTGSYFTIDTGFENHPVTYVSWYGATAFARYYGWRLPTEWEWQAVADYNGNYSYGCGTTTTNGLNNLGWLHPYGTTAVGVYGAYGYEMSDMAGNVFEWTNSCYYADCSDGYRIIRGGSWISSDANCTVWYRNYGLPSYMFYYYGFRVCR